MSADDDSGRMLGQAAATAVRLLRLSHLTIEHAADAVLWVSADGRIRRANEAAIGMLGYTLAELVERRVRELLSPDPAADGAAQAWPEAPVGRGGASLPRHFETWLCTKDGGRLPVEVALSALELEGEKLTCAFVRDIRERKRSEQALRDTVAELEALKQRLQAENVYLRQQEQEQLGPHAIIGQSGSLRAVLRQVAQVAPTDATVLVLGESGTGKELIARAVHEQSSRREQPLVRVNCAALPSNLIESELFGHEKGAFTGALQRRIGRFELADKGTLFLDEVGDLPLELQAKLLRVLQEGELERLGDARTIAVDVRIVAATNHDLEQAVQAGRFRADLYYRLNVFPLVLPPLRERVDDIELLASHFASRYARKLGRAAPAISPAMLQWMRSYRWPGNVRELQNVIERAVIVSAGEVLELPESAQGGRAQPRVSGLATPASVSPPTPTPAAPAAPQAPTLREVELNLMRDALEASGWVVGGKHGAASRLGIPASTLRERMARYGVRKS